MLSGPAQYMKNQVSPYCYDATWTLAYALNETLQGSSIASLKGITDSSNFMFPPDFTSSDIQYENTEFHDRIFAVVNRSDFQGITVSVLFVLHVCCSQLI